MINLVKLLLPLLSVAALGSCQNARTAKAQSTETAMTIPTFNADSAYAFVQRQIDFGPRVPATESHAACADYLAATLAQYGAQVEVQQGEMPLYSGEMKPLKNIIAHYNTAAKKRVLLCSHWDSRPFADQDANPANRHTPILGANDGASGVGVLLEIARQLQSTPAEIGVDIIFFDLEDWGAPEFYDGPQSEHSWCLGSQFWAKEAKKSSYRAEYGILLDMVGAPGAQFRREIISDYHARGTVDKVWNTAQSLGFGTTFLDERGGGITDDHCYVNVVAGIPCIDIIQYNPFSATGFADYWHTLGDDMRNIDRRTLYIVGQTLLQVIYSEKI